MCSPDRRQEDLEEEITQILAEALFSLFMGQQEREVKENGD